MLRVVPFAEADAVVTLFTRAMGKASALARGARKGGRRWAAALEPMHTLRVVLDEHSGADLFALREASVLVPRLHVIADLERMNAAGQALRWVRAGSPPRTPEPEVWDELDRLLARLDDRDDSTPPRTHLAAAGLRLLREFGYGLELASCVRCGRRCAQDRPAYVAAAQGGLVCQACGGGHAGVHHLLDTALRARLSAASSGRDTALLPQDTDLARALVDEALLSHAGVEP